MSGTDLIPIEMLKQLSPFSILAESHLPRIQKKGRILTHDKGKILFKRGECSDDLIYLLQGSVDLADANFGIASVHSGSDEATRPLCRRNPRTRTAVTTNPVRIFVVPKDYVDLVLTWNEAGNYVVAEIENEGDWITSLLSSALFLAVPPAKIQALFARFEEVRHRAGEVVVKQGDPGDYFYVLKSGTCRITRQLSQNARVKEVVLADLRPGNVFGEDALICNAPRNATATMITDGALMRLNQEDFEDLLQNPVLTYIKYEAVKALMKDPATRIELLDVRLSLEFEQGSIPGSRHLPLQAIRQNLSRLPTDTIYAVTCDGGRRSILGSYILNQQGLDARVLEDPPSLPSTAP